MATPITKTVGELFSYSYGVSCGTVYRWLDANHPGWTEDTSLDVLTYCEALRTNGLQGDAIFGICFYLNTAQKINFINYVLQKIIDYTPAGYSRRAAMVTLQAAIADYMAAPTVPKKNALLATAKAIVPLSSSDAELYVANAFKLTAKNVANNTVDGQVLWSLVQDAIRAAIIVTGGITRESVENFVLTKLEQLIGVVD